MGVNWHRLDAYGWRAAVEQTSAVEGIFAALNRIDELNPLLNAFTVVLTEEAQARAAELDALSPTERGPLHGVPVGKDKDGLPLSVQLVGSRNNQQSAEQLFGLAAGLETPVFPG